MDFSGQQNLHHNQHHAQYEAHEVCWCRGTNTLVEFLQDIKSSLRSLVREEVEEVVRRVILPHLSSTPDSTPPVILRSLPHQTEPSASKKLYLRIDDSSLPETLFTMNKIQHQADSLKVELVDEVGTRVEDDPESSTEIKIVVLNDDSEVEENDWSEEDFKKNLVRPRKDKIASLLKGKCKISLRRGVATVGDIAFTDNSKRGAFRLGAEVIKTRAGVNIRAAVSKPFIVKERRLLTDKKHEKPSPEDELWRLKNIRRDGAVYQRAQNANICTVIDFLRLLHTDPKGLQKILGIPESKWKDTVDNAEACLLPDDLYTYYDVTSGIELRLNCAFNIDSVKFAGQVSQLYQSLSDHQKEIVHEARYVAYNNRRELKPCTPMDQMQLMQVPPHVTCVPRIQHDDAIPVRRGELGVHSYGSLRSPPSCIVDHENPEIPESQPLDDPEWIDQMLANMFPAENDPVTKLRVACYVSMAATIFMVAGRENNSAPKRKRKFAAAC